MKDLSPEHIDAAVAGLLALNDRCSDELHVGVLSSDCVDCGACARCADRHDLLMDLLAERMARLDKLIEMLEVRLGR